MALLASIERRNEAGDYAQLERALGALRGVDPFGWRVWTSRYVHGDEAEERTWPGVLADAWAFIEVRMPELPKVPAAVRESERARRKHLESLKGRHTDKRALADRNREIRRRYERGEATVEELVRAFGLSRRTIYDAIRQ